MTIKEDEIRDEFGSVANYLKVKGFKVWAMRVLKGKTTNCYEGTQSESFRLKEQLKKDGFVNLNIKEVS